MCRVCVCRVGFRDKRKQEAVTKEGCAGLLTRWWGKRKRRGREREGKRIRIYERILGCAGDP